MGDEQGHEVYETRDSGNKDNAVCYQEEKWVWEQETDSNGNLLFDKKKVQKKMAKVVETTRKVKPSNQFVKTGKFDIEKFTIEEKSYEESKEELLKYNMRNSTLKNIPITAILTFKAEGGAGAINQKFHLETGKDCQIIETIESKPMTKD